jgi:hypothetical protein
MQHADAGFVGHERDRATVRRKRQILDVPVARPERLDPAGIEVEPRRAPELAVAVGSEEQRLAVAREVELARRDGPAGVRPVRRAARAAARRSQVHDQT